MACAQASAAPSTEQPSPPSVLFPFWTFRFRRREVLSAELACTGLSNVIHSLRSRRLPRKNEGLSLGHGSRRSARSDRSKMPVKKKTSAEAGKLISIRGAREHNLKNIDIDLPRDSLIVMTGLSGSGKSSLAFDTIYAEGQRRYVESLSAYARQFLEMMQKPDVDQIDGLSPAISIEQKTTSRNPRSTVGTVTEIYDYMRLLFARVGIPYSPATGLPIESQTVSQMVDRILALPEGTRLYLLAPVVRGRKGEYRKDLAEFLKKGFQRAKIDGKFYEIAEAPALDKKLKHDIDIVVDRVVVRADIAAAPRGFAGDGAQDRRRHRRRRARRQAAPRRPGHRRLRQQVEERDARARCCSRKNSPARSPASPSPRSSRGSSPSTIPFGACPECDGLGTKQAIDPELVVPDEAMTLKAGAIAPWSKTSSPYYLQTLDGLARHFGFKLTDRWSDLPAKRAAGASSTAPATRRSPSSMTTASAPTRRKRSSRASSRTSSAAGRRPTPPGCARRSAAIFSDKPCEVCHGARLKPEALAVKIAGLHISAGRGEIDPRRAATGSPTSPPRSPRSRTRSPARILKEIRERLDFLNDVGLDYLTLARNSGTLSGGESQRIRLATQIGSGLTGVLYVLDEPSIGLHQRDNARLLETLKHLRDLGNTVIVVEHDEEAILAADHVVDIGPAAGIHGGEIVAEGTPADIMANPRSLTGQYLSGALAIEVPERAPRRSRRPASSPSPARPATI